MAHRTFFSFHYERDVQRASVVRKSSTTKSAIDAEWIEAGIWEEAKTKGDAAIKRLIAEALVGTTVTAVLIGAETSKPQMGPGGDRTKRETRKRTLRYLHPQYYEF